MKRLIVCTIVVLSLYGCKSEYPNLPTIESVQYSEILMRCMDRVSIGGTLHAIIRNQAQYDSLIYIRFQKPLDDYWNAHYDTALYYVRQNNPGLSDSEYAILVREEFYKFLPFRGTENCTQPSIDFTQFTLLGLDAHASGCENPDYNIFVSKNNEKKELVYKIVILEHGYCDMLVSRNKWILIPKISESYSVVFQKEYKQAW